MLQQQKTLVLYHANCLDGFASAWIVGNWFGFNNVELHPVEYQTPVPDIAGREVFIVDFSYDRAEMIAAAKTAKNVVLLDHHKGALKHWGPQWDTADTLGMPMNLVAVVDTSKSGVGVTWNFFHGNKGSESKPLPLLLQYVQDYDLYHHKHTESRKINAALMNGRLKKEDIVEAFRYFGKQVELFDKGQGHILLELGELVMTAQKHWAELIISRCATEDTICGHRIFLCPMPYELRDIAGELLYKDRPYSITYEERPKEGITKFSLRSSKEGGVDVLAIAEEFGGSGHENAAGFVLPIEQGIRFRMTMGE